MSYGKEEIVEDSHLDTHQYFLRLSVGIRCLVRQRSERDRSIRRGLLDQCLDLLFWCVDFADWDLTGPLSPQSDDLNSSDLHELRRRWELHALHRYRSEQFFQYHLPLFGSLRRGGLGFRKYLEPRTRLVPIVIKWTLGNNWSRKRSSASPSLDPNRQLNP